jgi:nitrate/TMAO reductase-like tetraheme cytochrome c subunit
VPGETTPTEEKRESQVANPRKRRRLRGRWIALIVVAAVIVVLVVAAFVTAHYTSKSSFCDTCHEMDPYYVSWQASSHGTAECRDCHIPPGPLKYIETKLYSFREVYVHIRGVSDAPLSVTREIPNDSCFRCHSLPGAIDLGTVTFEHTTHDGQNCITCHVRVVHRSVTPPEYQNPGGMSVCLTCHNGTVAPSACSTCHTPGHEPRGECSSCHNTESWGSATGDHPIALTGGHAGLACTDCHKSGAGAETIPGTQLAKAPSQCADCHTPAHEARGDCATCHTTESFANAGANHPFELVGAHAKLSCAGCHAAKAGAETIPGTDLAKVDSACVTCHGDEHGGQLDCADCHTPEGWLPADFRHERVGEHMPSGEVKLKCQQCHTSGWGSPPTCSCHNDGRAGD